MNKKTKTDENFNPDKDILPPQAKYKTFDQILSMVGVHFLVCIIMMLTTISLVTMTKDQSTIKFIITIFNAVYFLANIYSKAYKCASDDLKPYHNVKAYPFKGVILPVGIITLTLISFILYKLSWLYIPMTETYFSKPCLLTTILYILLTSPFYAFVNVSGATSNLQGLILTLIAPVIASVIGYYFGYRKIDILKHFKTFMFEKKK